MNGWGFDHLDVGREIVTTEGVRFGEGCVEPYVPAGTRGVVTKVQPINRPDPPSAQWWCELKRYGRRAFRPKQFRFVSVLELLAEQSP